MQRYEAGGGFLPPFTAFQSIEDAVYDADKVAVLLIAMVVAGWAWWFVPYYPEGSAYLSLALTLFFVASYGLAILTYFMIPKLRKLSEDSKFAWGGVLAGIGTIISLAGMVLIILTLLSLMQKQPTSYQELMEFYSSFAKALGVLGAGGVISFVGRIGIGIAFYKFGEENDSSLISVGGLLFIFLEGIGAIMVGIGLKELTGAAKRFFSAKFSSRGYEEIKRELREILEKGMTVHLKTFAMSRGIPILILNVLVKRWTTSGELNGFVYKGFLMPQRRPLVFIG